MLPKKNRFRSETFKTMKGAVSKHSPSFFVKVCGVYNPKEQALISAVVSSHTAKTAVKRNLIRRQIYNISKPFLKDFAGQKVVITAKKEILLLKFQDLNKELTGLLKSASSG